MGVDYICNFNVMYVSFGSIQHYLEAKYQFMCDKLTNVFNRVSSGFPKIRNTSEEDHQFDNILINKVFVFLPVVSVFNDF